MDTKILFLKATPTQAQAEAGNYKKRKVSWNGLTISIENEAGSVRRGKGWQTKMMYPYGYINRTEAVDGDQVDVYIGPDESADTVYVVHQRKCGAWSRYDEDKCMLQFSSEDAARSAYLKHYDDPRFLGPITAMPVAEFVAKAKATKDAPKMIKALLLLKGGKGSGWWGPEHGGDHVTGGGGGTSNSDAAVKAALSQPLLDAPALDVLGLDYASMLLAGRSFYDSLMREGPIRCHALGGAMVSFDAHGWNYITDESYARNFDKNKNRSDEEVRLRVSLLPKARAAIEGAIAPEGPPRDERGTKRFPIIARFKDGDVIRVIVEDRHDGKHHFLSVFDLERVAKKLKRVAAPDPLHKSSCSTVQGAATDGDMYAYTIGGSVQYCNHDSITLIFPNGHTHILAKGQYSLDDALLKAQVLESGQRWITVHPNGKDNKGVPVMVQEAQHGSGVYHVIGGAGGKLNYLKLHGIKPESSYKEHAAERSKAKRDEKKVLAKRDKELGLDKAKGKAREAVKSQKRQEQEAFIKDVADAQGWKEEDLQPNIPDNVSDVTRNKLAQRHHSALLTKAHEAVNLQRKSLAADAMAREEAGGVVVDADEHNTSDAQLTVADLDDVRPQGKSGLGFSAHYSERAEAQGASEAVIQKEASEKKEARQANMSDAQKAAVKTRGTAQSQIKTEIAALREPVTANVKAVLADADKAVQMIKSQNKLKAVEKAAKAANKDIDAATEVKAWNMETSAPDEGAVEEDLTNDVRTLRTQGFLNAIKTEVGDNEKALRQHVGAGAFNSINGLALAGGGAALVDRSVIDVLGMEGAARVLARRLHADLTPERVEELTSGMEDYHLHHYMQASKEAMAEAQELHDAAKEIGLGEASHGDDFEAARELSHQRKELAEQAHKILGTALGEMEANAALVTAMKEGRSNRPLEVPMGKIADEDAIRQARAIGLQRGDYSIDRVAGQQVLTVTPEGMDRLSKPVDREEMARTQGTLAILNGEQDEDNWLPQGFAVRPDFALDLKPGVAPSLAQKFDPSGGDLQQALRDYIGGRTADGDSPAAIFEDIKSADFFNKSGDADAYGEALDAIVPRKDKDGKRRAIESYADAFNEMADSFAAKLGGKISPLQRQQFEPDEIAQEALHRALADEPAGIAAYKPIGELSGDDQQTLRKYFYAHVAHESPEAAGLRERLEKMTDLEPEKESVDMFGETSVNPDWHAWKSRRDTLAEEVGAASLDWQKYASAMHGHENAYAAMQDMIRSSVNKSFHEHHNTLAPDAPLKLGRQVIRNNLNHLDAVDPEARKARDAEAKKLDTDLRERDERGRLAAGGIKEKRDAERERREAFQQSQMNMFSSEEEPDMFGGGDADKPDVPLKADERYTLGHAAERTLGGMMGVVGNNFKPGRPLKIFNPTMSGPDGVMRQRAIKIIAKNKRVALVAGTGAGKTAMFLGAFSHLHAQGKAKRALMLVPSIVQGQVGDEALRFIKPGTMDWHCEPGASREERIAAHKNGGHHFTVMTHQSFRDDMLHLGAQHAGITPEAMAERLDTLKPEERAKWMKGVMAKEGINYDYVAADEAHNTLNRDGKENSAMANVIDATTANSEYFVHSSADLVKNDISEAYSVLQKMAPERYKDKGAFMRRYGVDALGSGDALKRELVRHVLPFKLEPKVKADKKEVAVKPTDAQSAALSELDRNIGKVRMARMEGRVDVDAMRAISPGQFKDAPEDQHEAIAKTLSKSLGIIKGSAVRNILDSHPESAKIDAVSKLAGERKGKPGVVFAHSLEAVENIKKRLEADGHRVVTLTGADSSEDKAGKIRGFSPDKGEGQYDIMVASDAGSTGANLQKGQWVAQFDTPQTAMTWQQRRGRVHRIGQTKDVELIDLVSSHPSERKARERLKNKDALRDLMSSPMEGLDDTGLASFLHERKVAQQQSMF